MQIDNAEYQMKNMYTFERISSCEISISPMTINNFPFTNFCLLSYHQQDFYQTTAGVLLNNRNWFPLTPGVWWGLCCSSFKFSVLCFLLCLSSFCVLCTHCLCILLSWLLLRFSLRFIDTCMQYLLQNWWLIQWNYKCIKNYTYTYLFFDSILYNVCLLNTWSRCMLSATNVYITNMKHTI